MIIKIILLILISLIILHLYALKTTNVNIEILQVNNPSKEKFEEIISNKLPTVITGCMNDWDEFIYWSPDYLKENYPEINIKISKGIVEQEKTKINTLKIKEFVDWIKVAEEKNKSDALYCNEDLDFLNKIGKTEVLNNLSYKFDPILKVTKQYAFWMGGEGTKTGIHYDKDYRNLLCQVYGTKKIYLWNPNQSDFLYKSNKYDTSAALSCVNFWNKEDYKKYPKFNKSNYIEIILHPGQILYIPPYWWHAVENINTNIAISIRTECPVSMFDKLITDLPIYILHQLGIYGNDCTCH